MGQQSELRNKKKKDLSGYSSYIRTEITYHREESKT